MGGGEWSLLSLAQRYHGERAVVLFEDGPFEEKLKATGVPVEVCAAPRAVLGVTRNGGALSDLLAVPGVLILAIRLARYARDYDILYANSQKALVIGAVASLLARLPLVWHLRDIITVDHFSDDRRRLAVWFANRFAARVICNSEATAAAFVQAGGKIQKTRVVYNGISSAPFDVISKTQVAELRASLGVGDHPVVGVFSRLAQWKGQHVLLEALAELPDFHALFVGDALFAEVRIYAEGLRTQAKALGVADRAHFLGFVDEVPALMKVCDVVAHTSVAPEPFGRVLVEGALAGRPIVATDAGGVQEVITDGETGRLTPPGDAVALAVALAEALRTLVADREAACRLVKAGRAIAMERFSEETMVQAVEAALPPSRRNRSSRG